MQKMYLLCFVYCVCTISAAGIGILRLFTVFTFSIFPANKQFPPLKRTESLANMFGKLIPLYSQCGFNSPQTRRQQLHLGCMYLGSLSGGEEGVQSKQTCIVSPTHMFTPVPDPNSRPPADHLN